MSWLGAIATIGGALLGGKSADKAADQQAAASRAATDLQRYQYDTTREDQAPYRDAGYDALAQLTNWQEPSLDPSDVMREPGYQFGLTEGLNNVQNTAAARGSLYSGNALKGLTQYANDYASSKYGDAWNRMQTQSGTRWNRLAGLAGIGQTANQQVQSAGSNYANQAGNNMMGAANAQGAAGMLRGNIYGNALNQLGSMAGRSNWFGGGGMYSDPTQIPMQPGGGY
jgi:hypothetical protein